MSVSYNPATRTVRLIVMGKPVAQGRPRFAKRGNFVTAYDPKKSKDYKALIQRELQPLLWNPSGFQPFTKACSLTLYVYREIPKSFSKKKRAAAEYGDIRPTTKPDTDNYVKGVLDALNFLIFKDDSQVVDVVAQKFYSVHPRIEVVVMEMEDTG